MDICTDKEELFNYFSRDTHLHLYAIADLDDFFWPFTTYFVNKKADDITAVLVKYQTNELPIVMALGDNTEAISELVCDVIPTLGNRVYAHISHGCEQPFLDAFECTYHETQQRMVLKRPILNKPESKILQTFEPKDASRLNDFFQLAYPNNWFDQRMLDVMPFQGAVINHQLVSIAGIHAFSKTHNVAALGNITTHPDFRGQGLGTLCTEALTYTLQQSVQTIGLNVHSENIAAKRCYEKVGFDVVCDFSEMMLEAR